MLNPIELSSNPLVSVIIPYYKHKPFIEGCLHSVVAQSYQNIELIVVDDCSPDGSGEFVAKLCQIKEIIERFSGRIKFESFSKNQGAHKAINYGISLAQGDIITVLNSDDLYHAARLEVAVQEMMKYNAAFVFTSVRYIDIDGQDVTETHENALNFRFLQNRIKNFPTVGFACLDANVALSTGNFVFAKVLYDKLGGFANYKYCHDWDFLLKSLIYTEPLFIDKDLYYYRFHGTNTFESLRKEATEETETILLNYFKQIQCKKAWNSEAPSAFNWPFLFELFLDLRYYSKLYQASIYEC